MHYLKSFKAKRTEILAPLIMSCKHVILLSGTPVLAKPCELFVILKMLRPDIFTDFVDFANRYCDPQMSRWHQGFDYNGSSNDKELHYILK